jgi:signal transduction histidine kinase
MSLKLWPEDTIMLRFAATIVLAIVVALSLTGLVFLFAGIWDRPSIRESGLIERVDDIVRLVEAAPPSDRQVLIEAVANPIFYANWYSTESSVAKMLDLAAKREVPRNAPKFELNGTQRRTVFFTSEERKDLLAALNSKETGPALSYFASVELTDLSWIIFTAPHLKWGIDPPARIGIQIILLLASIAGVSAIATFQLSRPIRDFTQALGRFGGDPRASAIPETGPRELRASIRAFNATQAQIQRFVDDRITMPAVISHDLRTPLTKMRLRGEFIADEEQRLRLFRDVDDMQAMIDSALAFFREDFQGEDATMFDFAQLLRTIVDDYNDQGAEVVYIGVEHVTFRGRPFALKRAFSNLIDNGIKYGRAVELEFRPSARELVILIRDQGPGIPSAETEQVFAPFYRLERSRNRSTGGVGLGLTSARAVIRAHGGDIMLCNQPKSGLEVEVVLPILG